MASGRCGIPTSARSVWVYRAAESSRLRQRAFLGCLSLPGEKRNHRADELELSFSHLL